MISGPINESLDLKILSENRKQTERVKGMVKKGWVQERRRTSRKRLVAGALILGLAAGTPEPLDAAQSGASGRYLETDVNLPETQGRLELYDIKRLDDGKLRLLGSDEENGMSAWDSADGGDTWELAASLPQEYENLYFTEATLRADGGGAGLAMENLGSSEEQYCFVSFDAQGNAVCTEEERPTFGQLKFLQDGSLVWMSANGEVYSVSPENGESINLLGSGADIIATCGSEALLLMDNGVQRVDVASGEPIVRDDALEGALFAGSVSYEINSSSGYPILFTEDEEGRLYYCTSEGIFSHVMGGGVLEQIVDGSLNALSDPSRSLVAMEIADQNFYVIYSDADGMHKLMKFLYDPDISSVPGKTLTIYSLREDQGIRQMIVLFQKEHPDIFVKYEVGMSGTDGMTSSDALRTLNTEILSGGGPDVLILDGMPVESYAKKGVLADLSGILDEVKAEDGLLENIAYTYQTEDGVPAVPSRFGVPVAFGETEFVSPLSDLVSLADVQKQGAMSITNILLLPEILYSASAASWKNEDGTINSEKLYEFIHVLRGIYSDMRENASPETLTWVDTYRAEMKKFKQEENLELKDLVFYYMGLLDKDLSGNTAQLCTGTLYSIDELSGISSICRQKESCEMNVYAGQGDGVFQPVATLGISAASKEQEASLILVKYLLSQEAGIRNGGLGFPVNAAAFTSVLYDAKWGEENGPSYGFSYEGSEEGFRITFSWPTQEELERFSEMVAELTVCADTQLVQQEVVLEEIQNCMDGLIGEEDAVNRIMQRINLYLME